jgi:hypothetical protein
LARRSKAHHTISPVQDFVKSLNSTQKKALRVLLTTETGWTRLGTALGTKSARPITPEEHATELARAGRTASLFRVLAQSSQNVTSIDQEPAAKHGRDRVG